MKLRFSKKHVPSWEFLKDNVRELGKGASEGSKCIMWHLMGKEKSAARVSVAAVSGL